MITPDAAPLSSGGDALVDAALRFAAGEPVDFCALFPEGGEVVDLPTSPLDRRRFWIDAADAVSPEHSPHLVSPSRAGLAHALAGVDEGARVAELSAFLREQVGEMLHLHPPDVPDDVEWVGLGIDSLRATELSNRVRAALGLNIPSKTVFEHATLRKLAAHLAGLPISPGSRASGPPGEASAPDSFEEGLV
ncbi:MAG: acyl carrier protein [Polyangiaceae bacterium]|nr:acyl carrier protein [Polyangiaceae bacterium]